jgi:hypothetical protein
MEQSVVLRRKAATPESSVAWGRRLPLAACAGIAYATFFGATILNPHDLDHTIIHHINSKAKDLEQTLGSDVVSYFGQIHPQYFPVVQKFYRRGKAEKLPARSMSFGGFENPRRIGGNRGALR